MSFNRSNRVSLNFIGSILFILIIVFVLSCQPEPDNTVSETENEEETDAGDNYNKYDFSFIKITERKPIDFWTNGVRDHGFQRLCLFNGYLECTGMDLTGRAPTSEINIDYVNWNYTENNIINYPMKDFFSYFNTDITTIINDIKSSLSGDIRIINNYIELSYIHDNNKNLFIFLVLDNLTNVYIKYVIYDLDNKNFKVYDIPNFIVPEKYIDFVSKSNIIEYIKLSNDYQYFICYGGNSFRTKNFDNNSVEFVSLGGPDDVEFINGWIIAARGYDFGPHTITIIRESDIEYAKNIKCWHAYSLEIDKINKIIYCSHRWDMDQIDVYSYEGLD